MAKPLPLNEQAIYNMYRANMALMRLVKPAFDELDLTLTQYFVMSTLWEGDDQTIGALADRLDLEPSTLTPLIKRLAEAEFLTRRRDPTHERSVKVALTEKGKALHMRAAHLEGRLIQALGITPDAMQTLNGHLRAVRALVSGRDSDIS